MKVIAYCIIALISFKSLAFTGGPVSPVWGKTGHRAVGKVAEDYLKNSTKRKLKKLLDGQSLAIVATYADDIKSDKRFRGFSPWHYVNIEEGKTYKDDPVSEYGDLIKAIDTCAVVLKDKNATKADKQFYLKLLIHFVGDLHQPMHVGRPGDKGGNDIQVQWFGHGSNLHKVWDSEMINSYGMSYTELSKNLPVLTKDEVKQIQEGTVLDWVKETQKLADTIYSSANTGEKLGYNYMYDHMDTLRLQLEKGGIRLAELLNEIF